MIRQIRIELLKLVTVRLSYGLLAFAAALTGIFSAIEAARAGTSSGVAPLNTYSGLSTIVTGGVWGLIFGAVLGVTVSSGEFRQPDRDPDLPGHSRPDPGAGRQGGRGRRRRRGVRPGRLPGGHRGGAGLRGRARLSRLDRRGDLLASLGAVLGSLVRSQLAAVIGVFVWSIILESLIGGLFTSVRPYLPYTAGTTLAGTALGAAGFGPSHGVSGGAPLPFAAATALLAGLAVVLGVVAARTTLRRDIA